MSRIESRGSRELGRLGVNRVLVLLAKKKKNKICQPEKELGGQHGSEAFPFLPVAKSGSGVAEITSLCRPLLWEQGHNKIIFLPGEFSSAGQRGDKKASRVSAVVTPEFMRSPAINHYDPCHPCRANSPGPAGLQLANHANHPPKLNSLAP